MTEIKKRPFSQISNPLLLGCLVYVFPFAPENVLPDNTDIYALYKFAILNHHSPVLNIAVAWSLALSPVDFVLLPQSAMQPIPKLNVEAKVDMEVLGKAILSIEMYFQWISGSTGQSKMINRNVISMDIFRDQGKTDCHLVMSQIWS